MIPRSIVFYSNYHHQKLFTTALYSYSRQNMQDKHIRAVFFIVLVYRERNLKWEQFHRNEIVFFSFVWVFVCVTLNVISLFRCRFRISFGITLQRVARGWPQSILLFYRVIHSKTVSHYFILFFYFVFGFNGLNSFCHFDEEKKKQQEF